MTYLITYDLNFFDLDKAENGNYYRIDNAINALAVSRQFTSHPLGSVWVIRSDIPSAAEVYRRLDHVFDDSDHVIVAEITGNVFSYLEQRQREAFRTVTGI